MQYRAVIVAVVLSALCSLSSAANAQTSSPATDSSVCLTCHDFGPDSPVHPMLAGAHGQSDNADAPMGGEGCEACHGPSAEHTRAPTQVSPHVSFGPRWSATIAAQDGACLGCHEKNVGKHWQDALHMVNGLTCVTCHDVHAPQDKAMADATQAEVCTVCHKPQKDGIHGLKDLARHNPACTTCHNPHDDAPAVTTALNNRSEGCRTCHDLVQMSSSAKASEKAKSYHKVMAQTDRTCMDCHSDVAHGPAGAAAVMVPAAASKQRVTLFYPGQSHTEWLISEHPGSQPLRQGSNCQQCHRGDEQEMGAALASATGFEPAFREMDVSFAARDDYLLTTLSWKGAADDVNVAIMWGDRDSMALERGSCFAACHSDMPGMSRDRGQQTGKYLMASRSQQRQIGKPAIVKDDDALRALLAKGEFGELWRLTLAGERLETATVLSGLEWSSSEMVSGTARFDAGRWTVQLQRELGTAAGYKNLNRSGKYTVGIALHGVNNRGGKHWVSLPMTLSFSGDDTDFKVE